MPDTATCIQQLPMATFGVDEVSGILSWHCRGQHPSRSQVPLLSAARVKFQIICGGVWLLLRYTGRVPASIVQPGALARRGTCRTSPL